MKIICSVLLLFSLFGKAQVTFQKSYYMGSLLADGALDLCVINESNFYIACYDYKILKLDTAGNVIWVKAYYQTDSINRYAVAYKIKKTTDDNLIIVGLANAKTTLDTSVLILTKIDTSSNLIWTSKILLQTWNTFTISGILEDKGLFYVTIIRNYIDTISGLPAGQSYLLCTDTAGNLLWSKGYISDKFVSILSGPIKSFDNQLIVAGAIVDTFFSADNRILISKLDTNGVPVLTKQFELGSNFDESCRDILITPDSNILLACQNYSKDIVLIKLDFQFNVIWATNTNTNSTLVHKVINSKNGGFALNNYSAILAFDSIGYISWSKNYGISGFNRYFNSIYQYNDGSYLGVGRMLSTTRTFISKTDSSGNAFCYTYNTLPSNTVVQLLSDTSIILTFDSVYFLRESYAHSENVFVTDTTWCLNYVGIDEIANYDALVFPNPIMSGEKLLVKGYYGQLNSISVFDAYGRICYSFLNINQNYFDFETKNLKSGIYFIVINNIKTFKLIVI